MRYEVDLTDAEWSLIEPFMPKPHAGEHLLRVTRRIIADVDQALRHATEVAKAEAGAVSIGFYTSLSSGPLRDAIAAYRAAMPKVAIDLFEGSPLDLLAPRKVQRSAC